MAGNTSSFPNQIDVFDKKYQLSASDIGKAEELKALLKKSTRTPEEDLRLSQLQVELKYAFIDPEEWNKFCDALVNMELFIDGQVVGFIMTKQNEINNFVTNKKNEMNTYTDGKKNEINVYTYNKKNELEAIQATTISTINTTKDNAINTIEQKKASTITYIDSTQAGELRKDIGVMADSAVTGLSLIDKTNTLKTSVDNLNNTVSTTIQNSIDSINNLFKVGSSNFNGTAGVVIPHTKGDLNYRVLPIPTQNPNGYLGEVWVEKAATSFKVLCSGSATTSFDYFMFSK